MSGEWSHRFRLHELARGQANLEIAPTPEQRDKIAKFLGLAGLSSLIARLKLSPWLDGMTVEGRLEAQVTYVCGVTLEPFEAEIEEPISLRFAPIGSPLLGEEGSEIVLDADAEDPPEALGADGAVDLAALVIEALSLALDPFPRKPDAVFEQPDAGAEISPFAALKALRGEP